MLFFVCYIKSHTRFPHKYEVQNIPNVKTDGDNHRVQSDVKCTWKERKQSSI